MLSKFSVRRPYTVFVAVVIVIVLGILSFQNMSMDFLPNMEFPYALVMTTYAGASPEEVERAVTEPVEQAMARINNIKTVQSMSVNNMSIVFMEFNDGTDMSSTTVDMRESLDQITMQWDDAIGSPTIMKMNPDMMPIMVAAFDYEGLESTEVTKKVEKDIIPEVESVEGVASVNESGGIEKKIEVIIQQDKIDKMNEKVQDAIDGKLSDAEKKLERLFKNVQGNTDLAGTIHELSLCWELSIMETYNDYTDHSAEIGWNLAIAYLKDNDKKGALAVLAKMATLYDADNVVGKRVRELQQKIEEL